MKTRLIIIVTILLYTLSFVVACSSKDITKYKYDYKGENTKWTAEYKGFSTLEFFKENGVLKHKETGDGNLVISYKGELSELSAVREIGYKFINGGAEMTFNQAPSEKTFNWNYAIIGPLEETVNLNIFLDGKTEIITIKSVK